MKWFGAVTKKMSIPSFRTFIKLIKVQCTGSWVSPRDRAAVLASKPYYGTFSPKKKTSIWVLICNLQSIKSRQKMFTQALHALNGPLDHIDPKGSLICLQDESTGRQGQCCPWVKGLVEGKLTNKTICPQKFTFCPQRIFYPRFLNEDSRI